MITIRGEKSLLKKVTNYVVQSIVNRAERSGRRSGRRGSGAASEAGHRGGAREGIAWRSFYRPVALVCRAVASRPASADGNNRVIGQVYQIYQLFHVGSEGLGRCQQQVGSGLEWIRILASRACHPLRCRRVRTDLKTLDVLFFFFSF